MRVLSLMLVAVVGLVALLPSSLAWAVTGDELAPPLLAQSDVPAGYNEMQRGPIDELTNAGIPNASVIYTRLPSLGQLSLSGVVVVLMDAVSLDAAGITPDQVIGQVGSFGARTTPIDAPAIGTDTQAYHITATAFGVPIEGDCVAWRQSGVQALVCSLGGGANAITLAQTQQIRLLYAFPG